MAVFAITRNGEILASTLRCTSPSTATGACFMKSVTSKNRLQLAKETLRRLTPEQLSSVGGASVQDDAGCRPPPDGGDLSVVPIRGSHLGVACTVGHIGLSPLIQPIGTSFHGIGNGGGNP
jgi:hypothetical protein